MISIIIPAHNEAGVLARCIGAMLEDANPGELEVIVVCNGCTDDSPHIARSFGSPVSVKELRQPSKVQALNVGDSAATGFPRFYVDADVVLSTSAIRSISRSLIDDGIFAGSPRADFRLEHSSWPVRAYYRVWSATDYFQEGMMGCGVYALSEAGRRRFNAFPDIIADDGFVRSLFSKQERAVAGSVVVWPPRSLMQLIKVRTRSRLGVYQLKELFPTQMERESVGRSYMRNGLRLLGQPGMWPAMSVYLLVQLVSRLRARKQLARLGSYRWERDESSR
jgi:glycosyltransferase involved in cell wall biosynthesis